MADFVPATPKPSRDDFFAAFDGNMRLVRYFEAMAFDVRQNIPDTTIGLAEQAQDTADQAILDAAAAQSTANSAQADATAAQADIDATQALGFVVVAANALIPNARTLASGANISVADGGPGGAVTVAIAGQIPIANGGTGANTAAGARTNLGLGSLATLDPTTLAKVSAFNNNGQSVNNATLTTVTNWTENFDQANNFNATTGVFTAALAGFYRVSAKAFWTSNAWPANGVSAAVIRKNGTAVKNATFTVVAATTTNIPTGTVTGLFQLAVNDTIDVQVFQNTGGAVTLYNGDTTHTYIDIEQVI